jgi:hypothetical protein
MKAHTHIRTKEAKAFREFVRTYSLFRSERLGTNIKLTFHSALVWSAMTYTCPTWKFATESFVETVTPAKQGSPHHW